MNGAEIQSGQQIEIRQKIQILHYMFHIYCWIMIIYFPLYSYMHSIVHVWAVRAFVRCVRTSNAKFAQSTAPHKRT